MVDPLFWLGLSILFVAVSLTAVLIAALPALRELARASRSAEKLFDTLSRELPPTLEAIRLTGMEISDLTDDVSEGVQSAGRVVKQFDDSVRGAKKQAKKVQVTTHSLLVGFKAAWKVFKRPTPPRRVVERLSAPERSPLDIEAVYSPYNAAASAPEFDSDDSFSESTDDSSDYYSDLPEEFSSSASSDPELFKTVSNSDQEEYYRLDIPKRETPYNPAVIRKQAIEEIKNED